MTNTIDTIETLSPTISVQPGISFKVLGIGLIAGTLDIADALIFNQLRGISPTAVLQYIASGSIGKEAFLGGTSSAALGLSLHYLIAIGWTFVYYGISRRATFVNHRPIVSGLSFGLLVYLAMNFMVLPASAVRRTASAITPAALINGVLAVLICIGLTTSVLVNKWLSVKNRND